MRKIILVSLIILILAGQVHALNLPYIDGDSIVVEAQGRGKTLTAAKIDARRSAAQTALGFMLEGTSILETVSSQKPKLEERLLRLSRAFIAAGEEELELTEDDRTHIIRVTLRVKVSGAELLNGLLHKPPEISHIDGASLAASAISRLNWQKETAQSAIELFNAFKLGDYIRVTAQSGGDFDVKNERMNFNINFKFDESRYFSEVVPAIVSTLDYISDYKIKGLPFNLPVKQLEDAVFVSHQDLNVKTMAQYLKLLGIEKSNKIINNNAGSANIYIQTNNYYFNAYKLNQEAFNQLALSLFNRNLNGMKGRAELTIDFINDSGRRVQVKPAGIKNMTGIMFFVITPPASLFKSNLDLLNDEQRSAIIILPAFSFNQDLILYQEDNARLANVKVSAEELLKLGSGSSVRCAVNIKY